MSSYHDERGATAVEYALFMAAVALSIIVIVGALGVTVTQLFVADWPW